jgi:biopolymer transport protein ExbB
MGALPLWAQEAAETATAEVDRLSWRAVVENGGWLMIVLAVMSLITVAFVIYFLAILRIGAVTPRPLHRELVEKLRAGDVKEARKACEYRPSPLAAVTLVAIDYVLNVEDPDGMLLKDVMQGEGSRQSEALEGQTRYLLDIAVIAPMVGLLGTVFGMLRAFSAVALDIAQARPMVLAGGVSQALVTTAFGLIVGIPAMIFYAYFRRRAATLVSQLEAASTDVLTALLSKKAETE